MKPTTLMTDVSPPSPANVSVAPPPTSHRLVGPMDSRLRGLYGLIGLGILIGLWWMGIHLWGSRLAQQFSPGLALQTTWELLTQEEIWWHISLSLKRVAVGLGLAIILGVPLGLLMGFLPRLNALLTPSFQFLRMISPLSWMPIAVMAFGIGDASIYFLLTFAAVWPVILNTTAGVQAINPQWLELGKSLAATRTETLLHIVLPAILGHVLTGLRLAVGIVWIVLVPSEMLGVDAGLGYFVLDTRDRMAYAELMAAILVIGLLGFLLDSSLRWLFHRWIKRL